MASPADLRPAELYPAGPVAPWFGNPVGPEADAVLELSSPPGHAHHTEFSKSPSEVGNGYRGANSHGDEDESGADVSLSSSFVLFSAQTVPRDKSVANTASLGWGALVFPGKQVVPGPRTVHRSGIRCQNCGAYFNLFCTITSNAGEWACSICKKAHNFEQQYGASILGEMEAWPELITPVVDYIEPGSRTSGFVSVADSAMSAPVVIIVDECVDESQLTFLQSSLHYFLNSLSSSTRIGIITYGKTVSVYDLSEQGLASADVLPGSGPPSQELLKMLMYGTGVYLAPLHVCLSIAQSIVSSLRPFREDLPEASRDRCMGTAIRVALTLIEGLSTDLPRGSVRRTGGSSRVIVCAGGPNTLGVGGLVGSEDESEYPYLKKKAIKQMEQLGRDARHLDTAVDIFAAGTCPVNISTVQPVTKASGGALVIHDDFGDTFGLNLERAVKRSTGCRGVVEMRCPKEVGVTRIIGPGEEAQDVGDVFKVDAALSIQMVSVEETQGLALTLELLNNLKDDYVHFQFLVRHTNMQQQNVTRVITVRLRTTPSVTTYLQSIDDEVLAVVLAKKMVLLAKNKRDAEDIKFSIDERLKDIAKKFGKQIENSSLLCFPAEIAALPEFLMHLRRGPLLGGIIGHEDERLVLVDLFLQASFDLALRMVAPRLLMHSEGGTFEELPAYDLALQTDATIVLDHGTDIFIWMGSEVSKDESRSAAVLAACRTLAHELSEHRFPAPRTVAFKEGSSLARYMQSRLIPGHKDPPYEQEIRFPQLQSLTSEQRLKLSQSVIHTDDLSFFEYMRKLKLVPPSHTSKWAGQRNQ